MDKKIKIGLLALGIILLIAVINYLGVLSFLNNYVSGTPNKSCMVDTDCVLRSTTCGYCDCGDAVNKDWNVFCPFRNPPAQVFCKMCPSPNLNFEIKCVENQCQRVWKNR